MIISIDYLDSRGVLAGPVVASALVANGFDVIWKNLFYDAIFFAFA